MTAFHCQILADSITPYGERLTTVWVTYPRVVHAEACRHGMHKRCAASSRAIPVAKFLEQVRENPYIPIEFGKNQRGMSADELLDAKDIERATDEWLDARYDAARHAERLAAIGVHKQVTNRLLEPFQLMTEVITATEWANFDHLRDHPRASPEMQRLARMIKEVMAVSKPRLCGPHDWHLPAVTDDERRSIGDWRALADLSAGRLARASYAKVGADSTVEDDTERAAMLLSNGHMSPFEHQARPQGARERRVYEMHTITLESGSVFDTRDPDCWMPPGYQIEHGCNYSRITDVRTTHFCGPFNGWRQYRKMLPREWDRLGP